MAVVKKINKNGQIEYTDENGKAVTSAGTSNTNVNTIKSRTEEENDYYKDMYGMDKISYDNLVMSSGSGSEAPKPLKEFKTFDQWKKDNKKENGSSNGINTIPLSPEEQKQIDISNDATRQQKEQIKQTANEVRDEIRKNNILDQAEEARKKYDLYSGMIDTHYTDGLPRSILAAYKSGRFGNPESKDAKSIRNTLLLNELGTMLSNIGAGIKGGETKEGLWSSSVRRNMEEADKRNNEKFEANMMNQIQQLDVGAKDQIELEKMVNQVMADNVLSVAAKHANNIEDTIGLWHLKEAMGERWNKMTPKQQMSMMNAVNAFNSGDTASGKAILHAALGDEGMADIQKRMTDYSLRQTEANTNMAETNAKYLGKEKFVNLISQGIGAANNAVTLAGNVATGGIVSNL